MDIWLLEWFQGPTSFRPDRNCNWSNIIWVVCGHIINKGNVLIVNDARVTFIVFLTTVNARFVYLFTKSIVFKSFRDNSGTPCRSLARIFDMLLVTTEQKLIVYFIFSQFVMLFSFISFLPNAHCSKLYQITPKWQYNRSATSHY